jgi:hypothetical protein
MNDIRHLGLDVCQRTTSAPVLHSTGKLLSVESPAPIANARSQHV